MKAGEVQKPKRNAMAKRPPISSEEACADYARRVKKVELAPWPSATNLSRDLLNYPVAELELPIHMLNAFSNINVRTIGDLIAQPGKTLLRVLGKRRLKDVQSKFRELGIVAQKVT